MKDYKELIKKYLKMDQAMLASIDIDAVNQVMNVLEDARRRHAGIYICGNGGSAATASHFVCDFNKGASQGSIWDRGDACRLCERNDYSSLLFCDRRAEIRL